MQNNKTLLAMLWATALLCSACATEEPAQQVAQTDTDRECRSTRSSGSKMRRRVCHTVAEWREIDAQARDEKIVQDEFFRRARESGSMSPAPTFSSPAPGG